MQTLANATCGAGRNLEPGQCDPVRVAGESHLTALRPQVDEPVPLPGLTQQGSDFSPQFLPDGRHFLYYVRGNPEVRGVYVGQLDATLEARRLLDSDSGAVYASSGHLLFVQQGKLFAQTLRSGRAGAESVIPFLLRTAWRAARWIPASSVSTHGFHRVPGGFSRRPAAVRLVRPVGQGNRQGRRARSQRPWPAVAVTRRSACRVLQSEKRQS